MGSTDGICYLVDHPMVKRKGNLLYGGHGKSESKNPNAKHNLFFGSDSVFTNVVPLWKTPLCVTCKRCMRLEVLKAHIKYHKTRCGFTCERCGFFYVVEKRYKNHLKSNHNFKCELCPATFVHKGYLHFHRRVDHERKNFAYCLDCKMLYLTKDAGSTKTCTQCTKMAARTRFLGASESGHSGLMSESTGRSGSMSDELSHDEYSPQQSVSSQLMDEDRKPKDLKASQVDHDSYLYCDTCEGYWDDVDLFNKHSCKSPAPAKAQGLSEIPGLSRCEFCLKYFSSILAKSAHYRDHIGSNLYHCGECTQSFAALGLLKDHIVSHMNV